jgi:hypothetical protein
MANTKISALGAATTPVAGTEVLPIVQSSTTVKLAISDITPGLSTITAVKGGTGQTSYAIGDLLYANTTTTLAKLADVATGNALISGGVGVAPSWGKIGLTTHVSGTLPVANGGTGVTTSTGTTNVVLSGSPTLVTPKGVQGISNLGPGSGLDFKSGGAFMAFMTWPVNVTVTSIDYQYVQAVQDNVVEVIQYKNGAAAAVTIGSYTATPAGTRSATVSVSVSVTAGTRFFIGPVTSNNNNQSNIMVSVSYTTA